MKDFAPKPVNEVRYNRHPKRKNNEKVAAMYAAYSSGKSLEEIGDDYGVTRQSVYSVFKTRGYALRSKQLKGLQILDGIKFTLTKCGYLRGTHPDGRRILMHHYVWEKDGNPPIQEGWDLHHINRNKQDNRIENLEYLTTSEHTRKYSPHLNQFTSPTGSRRKKWETMMLKREEAWKKAVSI